LTLCIKYVILYIDQNKGENMKGLNYTIVHLLRTVEPKGEFSFHAWRFIAVEFIVDGVKYYRCYDKDTMELVDKSVTLV